jgi:hypothetical protein
MEKYPKQMNKCITKHVKAITFTTTQEQPTTLRALPSESILQSCIHHHQTKNIYKIAENLLHNKNLKVNTARTAVITL